MSDFSKMFQDMIDQSMEMGQKFAAGNDAFDASAFEKMMPGASKAFLETAFGATMNPEGLDAKTRFLVTIAALVAQGATQAAPLKLAIKSALTAGAGQQQVCEVIVQMAAFGGVPAMTAALEVARETFAENSGETKE